MHHISHLHGASASSGAILLPKLQASGPTLVLVQHTSLLLISLTPGLAEVRVPFNARLASAKAWGDDTLLVLTDHAAPRLLVLRGNASGDGKGPLSCLATLQLEEALRPAVELGLGLDVALGLAVAHTHVGTLRVWPTAPAKPDVALAYAVRTPHPHLIAHTLLDTSPPTLALLSISSSPSTLPGLGDQCLPVLSFHSFDAGKQELAPLPWSTGVRPAREKAGASTSQAPSSDAASSSAARGNKKYGAAAMGKKRTPAEQASLNAPSLLARAHVPLEPRDAVGAHAMLALPHRSGAAILVACETALLLVGVPSASATAPKSPAQAKRHKASKTGADETSEADVLAASPDERANNNGKRPQRRRSSAAKGVEIPEETKATNVEPGMWRASLSGPSQIRAMAVLAEPDATQDAKLGIVATSNDEAHLRVLLATHAGKLLLAEVNLTAAGSSWQPTRMTVRELGSCPAPAGPGALAYCGEGIVAIACASGDSALLNIASLIDSSASEGSSSSAITTLHTVPCLAPILDFVADDGAGGEAGNQKAAQARVITASGTGPSGSLRVVRHGAQLETLAELELKGVNKAWPTGTSSLVCSTPTTTAVFELGAQMEETTIRWEIEAQLATLNVLALQQGQALHANARAITLLDATGKATQRWTPSDAGLPNDSITLAAFNASGQALVACRGSHVLYLEASPSGWSVTSRVQLATEPSALDISSPTSVRASLAAVALWSSRTVQLLKLPTLEDATPTALLEAQPSLPRSLLLHTFSGEASESNNVVPPIPHLLVGLDDGRLASYALAMPMEDSMYSSIGVFESRLSTLGTHPLRLCALKTSLGLEAVLVSGDRPALLWASGTRLSITAVPAREVRHASALLSGEESATLLVLPDALRVVRIGEIEKLDVRTAVELGSDNPLAIAQCAQRKAVVATTWRFLPQGSASSEPPLGKVLLFDQEDFAALDSITLPIDERPNCVSVAHLPDGTSFILVGTGIAMPDHSETTEGRLLGYYISPIKRKLSLAFEASVNGNVFAVTQVEGLTGKGACIIAAAVNAEVVTFAITPDDEDDGAGEEDAYMHDASETSSSRTLDARQVGQWGCAFTACTLSSTDAARLVVGDALRSLVVLDVSSTPTMRGHLSEVARDCDPYWTTAAELLDVQSETYVGADIAFNLYTTQRAPKTELQRRADVRNASVGGKEADSKWSNVMERRGTFHYGDLINKMRRGTLVNRQSSTSTPLVDPRILFCTAAGAIGVLTQLDEKTGLVVGELERNMRLASEPLGGIAAEEWRTLRTDHRVCPPTGFVDGDLLSQFASLTPDLRERVLNGPTEHTKISATPAEVRAILEALSRVS